MKFTLLSTDQCAFWCDTWVGYSTSNYILIGPDMLVCPLNTQSFEFYGVNIHFPHNFLPRREIKAPISINFGV